jgi:hypothetical protein
MGCGCFSKSSKSLLLSSGGKKKKTKRNRSKQKPASKKSKSKTKKYQKKMRGGSNFIGSSISNPVTDVVNFSSKLVGFPLTNPYSTNPPANQSFGYGNNYKV